MEQPTAFAEDCQQSTPSRKTWRDAIVARALSKTFSAGTLGRLDVTLPSGLHVHLGSEDAAPGSARVIVNSYKAMWRLATRGSLGLAESYMRQEIDTPDLGAVLRLLLEELQGFGGDRAWRDQAIGDRPLLAQAPR